MQIGVISQEGLLSKLAVEGTQRVKVPRLQVRILNELIELVEVFGRVFPDKFNHHRQFADREISNVDLVRFECLYCGRHQSVLDHVVLEDLEGLDYLSGAHLVDLFLDHFT